MPSADELPRGPYGNLASFIDGPRQCIGWRLAILEVKVIVAHLIRDMVFETTGSVTEKYISGTIQAFTEGKAANLPLKIRTV
jgi:cytochrome P450